MQINTLRSKVRKLGYELSVREMYGENTPAYYDLVWEHRRMLARLYDLEKRINQLCIRHIQPRLLVAEAGLFYFFDNQRLTAPPAPEVPDSQALTTIIDLIHFFLAVIKKLAYYVYMKVRVRKPILFTKSRPHQVKTRIIHRKQKHKEVLNYVYS